MKEVDIDLASHRVAIRYDAGSADEEHLRSLIGEAGYETSVV